MNYQGGHSERALQVSFCSWILNSLRLITASKTVPDRSSAILKVFCIVTVFRSKLTKPFAASGYEQVRIHWWLRGLIPEQIVYNHDLIISLRLKLPNMLIKVIPVKRAEGTGTCFGIQSPLLQYVPVTFCTSPTHGDKREVVGKEFMGVLMAPPFLLFAESHVHFVCLYIFLF